MIDIIPLKPSLEGWKLSQLRKKRATGLTLKPSLEGWKLERCTSGISTGRALKPSLEGWKPGRATAFRRPPYPLETFLRGMETWATWPGASKDNRP